MEITFALDTLIVSVIKFLKRDAFNKAIYDLLCLFMRRLTSYMDLLTLCQWLSATISFTATRPI